MAETQHHSSFDCTYAAHYTYVLGVVRDSTVPYVLTGMRHCWQTTVGPVAASTYSTLPYRALRVLYTYGIIAVVVFPCAASRQGLLILCIASRRLLVAAINEIEVTTVVYFQSGIEGKKGTNSRRSAQETLAAASSVALGSNRTGKI